MRAKALWVGFVFPTALLLASSGCDREAEWPAAAVDVELVSTRVETGAACDDVGDIEECHSTEPVRATDGRQVCLVGERRCEAGRWGACRTTGEQPWPLESAVSETGVLRQPVVGSPGTCGGCDTRCRLTTDTFNDAVDDLAHVRLGNDGSEDAVGVGIRIGAGGTSTPSGLYAWVAHTDIDQVSKVHLVDRTVDGRYRVGISSISNKPSRTAVDGTGNAYVAQRAFSRQGTVTKIAGDLADCLDLNGDGDIDTSNGTNVLGWPGTASQDECVLWQVPVGGIDAVPRALTIDQMGRIWVGLHTEQRFVVLDPDTGAQIGSVGGLTSCPYGAVTDSTGRIWYSALGTTWTVCGIPGVQWIDGTSAVPSDADRGDWYDPPVVDGTNNGKPYGITIDTSDRLFMAEIREGGLLRFDTSTFAWDYHNVVDVSSNSSGVTYHVGTDRIYLSHGWSSSDLVTIHNPDTLAEVDQFDAYSIAGIDSPHGMCPDYAGNIWITAMNSARFGIYDPVADTLAWVALPADTYTYSDFTGYSHTVVVATSSSFFRTYRDTDLVCAVGEDAYRDRVSWQAIMPPGASLSFFGAAAATEADLASATEVNLGSSNEEDGNIAVGSTMIAEGEDPTLAYFRIRVVLHRGDDSPVVESLSMTEYCQP